LISHGDSDDLIPIETASKLASKLGAQKNIEVKFITIKGANHFYKNKISLLNTEICRYLDESLAPKKEEKAEKKKLKKK
jgi:alpha/beta superfamily hydrolase